MLYVTLFHHYCHTNHDVFPTLNQQFFFHKPNQSFHISIVCFCKPDTRLICDVMCGLQKLKMTKLYSGDGGFEINYHSHARWWLFWVKTNKNSQRMTWLKCQRKGYNDVNKQRTKTRQRVVWKVIFVHFVHRLERHLKVNVKVKLHGGNPCGQIE